MKTKSPTLIVLALLVSAALCLRSARGSDEPRPNLLFVLTDDQRFDMMGNVNPALHTPHMDQLVRDGLRFENAFVTTSICMASRASILSGTYERTHRYTGGAPTIDSRFMQNSYPYLLKQAGYQTGYVGKWHVKVEEGITDLLFDSYVPLRRNPYFKVQKDGSERHLTDLTGDGAIEFLRSLKGDRPFCLSVSFNAPHAEDWDPRQYIWPESADLLYQELEIPRPPLSNPSFFDKLPAFLKFESMNRHRWYWRFDNERKRQMMTRGYYRMISGVDAVIGRLREELSRLGLAGNTVIVLSSDNGYFLGERGWAGKWKPHEVSLRVPLVLYDPRQPVPSDRRRPEELVLNIDIAPTLLELASVKPPDSWQGQSLVPFLRGESPNDWRRDFFHEYLGLFRTICNYEGIRTEQFKYARYFDQDPVYEEVYDLKQDPQESKNLADDPAFAELKERLSRRCDVLRDRVGGVFVPW